MPTSRYAIDAGILALFFAGRSDVKPYFDKIFARLASGYMCEINIAEFFYNYAREFGWDAAQTKVNLLRRSPIEIPVIDESLTERAARLKLEHANYFSLADCYLLAMSRTLASTVLTTEEQLKRCEGVRVVHIPF